MGNITSKAILVAKMAGTQNPAYFGWSNAPTGNSTFDKAWADIADLLFVNALGGGSASTARAAFITAMAHAVNNDKLESVLENAFLQYLLVLETGMVAGQQPTPAKPKLTSLHWMLGSMDQLEDNQMHIDKIARDLYVWAKEAQFVPSLPAITGTTPIYKGTVAGTRTLANATSGGVWTSGTAGTATINSSTGLATAVAAGTSIITYTITNAFGDIGTVTKTITIITLPAITGTTSFAHTTTSQLANTIAGGVWASSDTNKATVDASTGLVTGVASGSCNITYTMPDGAQVTAALTLS